MKNKTKAELIEKIEELEEKIEHLENDVDYWQKEYEILDEELDKVNSQLEDMIIENGIKDINNFIWKLKLDNLYTNELENFVNHYLRFYNQ